MTIVLMTTGLHRAVVGEPFVLRDVSQGGDYDLQFLYARSTSLGFGACGGLVALLVAARTGSAPQLFALGLATPLVILHDLQRTHSVATGKATRALHSDLLWAGLQIPLSVAVLLTSANPSTLIALWIAGLALSLTPYMSTTFPMAVPSATWIRPRLSEGIFYGLEYLGTAGIFQGTVFLVASTSSVQEAGAWRAAATLFGPFLILEAGIRGVLMVRFARLPHQRLRRAALLSSAGLTSILLIATSGLMLLWPHVGSNLFGRVAPLVTPLLLPFTINRIFHAATNGPLLTVRALGEAKASSKLRLVAGLITLGFLLMGLLTFGLAGAAWGLTLGGAFAVGAWFRLLVRLTSSPPNSHRDAS